MNCRYCQQETISSPQPETNTPRLWCQSCDTYYFVKHSFHVIYCTYKGLKYSVIHSDDRPKHWTYISVGLPKESKIAVQLHTHANITPQNFIEKLKTYLIFS